MGPGVRCHPNCDQAEVPVSPIQIHLTLPSIRGQGGLRSIGFPVLFCRLRFTQGQGEDLGRENFEAVWHKEPLPCPLSTPTAPTASWWTLSQPPVQTRLLPPAATGSAENPESDPALPAHVPLKAPHCSIVRPPTLIPQAPCSLPALLGLASPCPSLTLSQPHRPSLMSGTHPACSHLRAFASAIPQGWCPLILKAPFLDKPSGSSVQSSSFHHTLHCFPLLNFFLEGLCP